MQHVDDGTIHAWLDRQVTDPEEVARIETHLRECPSCRARLADERATLEQADALLAAAAPVAEAGRPAFETIVARAGSGGSGPADSRSGFRTWVMPVGWAASVALAAALGWAVRDRAPLNVEPQSDGRTASQTAAPPTTSSPVVQGQSQSGNTQAPASQPASDPKPETRNQNLRRQESSQRKALEAPAAQTFTLNGTLGEPAVPSPAKPAAEPPRPVDVPTQRDLPELSQAPAGGNSQSAPPPLPASPPPTPAPAVRTGVDALDGAAPVTEARGAPPAPAAGAPAGGGGGGGGGRGARAGGGGGRAGGGGRGRAEAPPGDGANQGRIVVGGTAVAGAGAADANAWRALPRTDAAAQSGMALYGIDGLMPMATMLSADNSAVRTLYRLESGETIELVQQKVAPAFRAGVDTAGATSTTTEAPAQLGQAQGQGQGQGQRPAGPPPWTIVRDDVRLTLRGTANLSALGERLRLD